MAAKEKPRSRLADSAYPKKVSPETAVGLLELAATSAKRYPKGDAGRAEVLSKQSRGDGGRGYIEMKPKGVSGQKSSVKCNRDTPIPKEVRSALVGSTAAERTPRRSAAKVVKVAPTTRAKPEKSASKISKKSTARSEKPVVAEKPVVRQKPVVREQPGKTSSKTPVEKAERPTTRAIKPEEAVVGPGRNSGNLPSSDGSTDSADAMPAGYNAPKLKVNPKYMVFSAVEKQKQGDGGGKLGKFREPDQKQSRHRIGDGHVKKKRKYNWKHGVGSHHVDKVAPKSIRPKRSDRSTARTRLIIILAIGIIGLILVCLIVFGVYLAAAS